MHIGGQTGTRRTDRRKSPRTRLNLDGTSQPAVSTFTRPGGEVLECKVVDFWLEGLTLQTMRRPPVSESIQIGQMSARVMYHYERGIGVEFSATLPRHHQH
jgi:hypothetical protein